MPLHYIMHSLTTPQTNLINKKMIITGFEHRAKPRVNVNSK